MEPFRLERGQGRQDLDLHWPLGEAEAQRIQRRGFMSSY